MTLTWEEPDKLGGALINNYLVEMKRADMPDAEYKLAAQIGANKFKFEPQELRPEVSYLFRIRAVNNAGPSDEYAELDKPVSPLAKSECTLERK